MFQMRWFALLLAALFVLVGCPEEGDDDSAIDDDDSEGDDDDSAVPDVPFAQFCGQQMWDETLVEATVGELSGAYIGYYDSMPDGTVESMKLIPEHPFWVTHIRAAYGSGSGPARIRLVHSWGRSYPDVTDEVGGDLTEPLEFDVSDPDANDWLEFDVSDREIFLMPTQHYHLANEKLEGGPFLALENLPEGESSRALLLVPDESMPYGSEGNFRLELRGHHFCSWEDTDFWFGEDVAQPWEEDASSRAAVVDLDGDGNDDLIVNHGGPIAYLGDGAGNFAAPATDPFEDWSDVGMAVFGDVDNDGDLDAFASVYVGADDDGDWFTKDEGDCNDADTAIKPSATEQVSNGIDDDCDGVADDGTDTSDADGDGFSIFDGDCNDLDALVFPGALEEINGYDDDCDGIADDGTDTSDADGDWTSIADGDCNDTDPAIYLGANDTSNNGIDDDCDGVVDNGVDTTDRDADGFSVLDGDCDDTRAELNPGADEIKDGMDNDCDGVVDESAANRILLNDGGVFTLVEASGVDYVDPSTAAGFGDADGDGWLDLYYGNWLETYPYDAAMADHYFEGYGDGTFDELLDEAGMSLDYNYSVYGVMWNDYNNDGWPDVFVGNYHMYPNQLWQNQGDGTFVDVAFDVGAAQDDIVYEDDHLTGGHTYGGDFGDIDNDGDMDMFMCNLAHPRVQPWSDPSMFLVNDGEPTFTFDNQLLEYGFIYDEGDVNAQFGDFDNDMDLDLVVASLYGGHYSKFYRNDGPDGFTDITYETASAIHDAVSVVWSDVDNDGDLDLFLADRNGYPYVHLLINRVGQDNHFVEFDLRGTDTNRDAVGARVTVVAGGVTQMRDVQGGGGHSNTQHSHVQHFGLGGNTTIDEVTVRWVGGDTEVITGIEADHRYEVVEGSGSGTVIW